jgi:hypothetical protein
MSTLTGNQVKDTYRSLLKLEDNGSLSANLKIVQDGIGTSTPLSISTTAISSSVNIQATGFKTPGGTASDYLRADGSTGTLAIPTNTDGLTEGVTNLYNVTHTGDVTGSAALTISAGAVDGGKINTTANVQINSLGVGTAAPAIAGLIRATNDVVAYYASDKRLKDNIKPIKGAIEKVNKLGGYEFDWNNKQDVYTGHDYGVIAQEVESVFPELVTTRDNGYKAVKYEKLVAVLLEAVKELSKEVETLKNK